jgi:mRNA interferase MazF
LGVVVLPRRGEVWWVDFDPTLGSEIKKRRPAIVVSNDLANRYSNLVTVIPLTSNTSKIYPVETLVTVDGKSGKAMADQIRSIDKSRLAGKLAQLSDSDLEQVERVLSISLGLPL